LQSVDVDGADEEHHLAAELAQLIAPMRASSRFAVRAFIQAAAQGVHGASLTIYVDKPNEARLEIDPR
jgi:hypothetical protein